VSALPKWLFPVALVVALLVAASLTYRHFANRGVSPTVRDSIAVLKASRRPDSIAHTVFTSAAETASVRSQARTDSSRVAERRARVHQQLADSAADAARSSATARDSAEHWRVAFVEEKKRGDSLDVALQEERRASADARASALSSKRADSASQARLARVERLNADVVSELSRVSSGCHLLPFVRCPTRTETAIGSAVLTYVAVRKVTGKSLLP
jgi:hypothetical protein